ncbi:hypothetical protein CQA66_00860 [Helicobacter aurati]|uniref:Tetrapyrrole biosynthesis uroporphyrinogen III synthase domain-containing protein n=1 Tax=Helicobacter aurati TaxID=137778 RepID=A0A3D8J8E0_9HELI|nr:uroporphyrinogen-III synthase [Helicobacter aurati]RDU73767.1 hypothetical protein CQA66_00860 [Helicobacter aurati]
MIYILKSDKDPITNQDDLLHNVRLLSLLQIQFHDFTLDLNDIEQVDYLLFTSKNALKAVINHRCFDLLKAKQALFLGEKSKNIWLQKGGKYAISPKDLQTIEYASGEQFARLIAPLVADKHVLYLCGKDKATDFKSLLHHSFVKEIIVYSSLESAHSHSPFVCSNDSVFSYKNPFEDESIFIFGSPKHYRIFCKYYGWNPSWLAISLGDTTFQSFGENVRKLNAKGNFQKALKVAQALCDTTPLQHNIPVDHVS